MPASRSEVYAVLDGERAYQDAMGANAASGSGGKHEVAAFLTYMRDYLLEADHTASRDWSADADFKTLAIIRKVTALGVACMEQHGAPPRIVR